MELLDLTFQSMEKAFKDAGYKAFRARQVFRWLYVSKVFNFEQMSNISKKDRDDYAKLFSIDLIAQPEVFRSDDETEKLTFTLDDGAVVESVIIPDWKRVTLCISTQAGCPLKCDFCRTGTLGFKRDLRVSEITGQVIRAAMHLEGTEKRITNIVYMGMGEPLLNFDNTVDSINILLDNLGMKFPKRKVTISTAGVADKMVELGERTGVNLAVSLHAVNDEKRSEIMNINKRFPLKDLIQASKDYPTHPRKLVVFEYIMLKGFNDTMADAKKLAKIAHEVNAKINLIPFHTFDGAPFEPTPMEDILKFQKYLKDRNVMVLIRKSRGEDKLAACGQLGKV